MHTFSPSEAAAIASGVYLLREKAMSVSQVHKFGEKLGCEDMFDVNDGSKFEGYSGLPGWRALSGFGYIAQGKGAYAGEVLLVTRGTASMSDWLTDAHIGLQRGPSGLPVHAGFNEVWKSFAAALREFLRGRNPSRIHCVGHSLGGALAMLNADFLTENRVADVQVYTFGAPRVGDGFFARSLTERIGANQIYRVSNPVDPVPMIPLFPFWHLPFGASGHQIGASSSLPISPSGHKMLVSYIPGVKGKDWNDLAASADPDPGKIKSWLMLAAEGQGSFLKGSAWVLTLIGRALAWMLGKASQLVFGCISAQLTASFTALDQIAWLLSRSADLCREMGLQLKGLVAAIAGFLGRRLQQGVDITRAFLRWVLDLLLASLRAAGQLALSVLG